jgi:outer membrane protein OmpA-like peptidoglycan-associated protein
MKTSNWILIAILLSTLFFQGCKSWNRTQKGAAIGTATGGAAGAIIGKASGNTALGAVIGAAVGGAAGAVIGNQMDKQAAEIKKNVPGATVHRVGEGIVIEFSSNVLFGFDSYALTPAAKSNLDQLVTILQKYPDTDIEIHGHTDSQGTAKYNQGLSERRANAVSSYLSSKNVAKSRLTSIGYGEKKPKFSNSTAADRAKNRRVEFAITANEKMKREAANQSGK